MMFKFQRRVSATDEASAGEWEDDPRRFETEQEAENYAARQRSIASLDTEVIEVD